MLAPAIGRIKKRTGNALPARSPPTAATAKPASKTTSATPACATSYYQPKATERRPPPIESRRAFRRMVRWRTGCEGRINCVKRYFGLPRTRFNGLTGARTWCGHGVFNHNLIKISGLIE